MPRVLLLLVALLAPPAAGAEDGLRALISGLGHEGSVEVRDLPPAEAEAAIKRAIVALRLAERELDAGPGGEGTVARLNAAAGLAPIAVDEGVLGLLTRASNFCRWLDGAHGPLGGPLYDLWRERAAQRARPAPDALREATERAACDGLIVDAAAGTAALAAGSRLELIGFALGFAVDRAAEALREAGAGNARVVLGPVQRALGPGPRGRGWAARFDRFPGMREPLQAVRLADRALAVVRREALDPPLLDQRTGEPSGAGVGAPLAVLAVTELAVDAQALATSMFITGSRNGQLRLGALRPQPSVLWLLGDGVGEPVLTTHRWTLIDR